MRYNFLVASTLLLSVLSFSQNTVQKERVLSSSDKELGLISAFGLKSAVRGGPSNNLFFTSALEVTNVKNSGFVIREDYKFTKYNDLLEKEWEKKIDNAFNFSLDGPRGETLGNNDGIFFYEYTSIPVKRLKNFNIVFFDPKGNSTQKDFKLEKKYDGVACSFLNANGLNVLVYDAEGTTITYELLTFSRTLQLSQIILPLKTDPIEAEAYLKKGRYLYVGWKLLNNDNDRTILAKSYFVPDDLKSYNFSNINPDKNLVLQTVELTSNNKLVNAKDFSLKSLKIEGNCTQPQLFFDVARDEIYAIETYTGEKRQYGGLYFLKFKYANIESLQHTNATVDKTMYAYYSEVSQSLIFDDPHDNRIAFATPHKIAYYPHSGTFDFWSMNSAKIKNYGYVWLRFDTAGKQLASANVFYINGIGALGQLFPIPKESTEYTANKPLKASPTDFIFDLSKKIDVKNVAHSIIEKADHYTVITISEEKSEFKAYNISK